MVDYREILRLQSLGHNITQIAGALHSSRNTVREVERLADEKEIRWPLEEEVTNPQLYVLLYPERQEKANVYLEPAFCGARRTLMRFRADAMQSITDAPKRSILLFSSSAGLLLYSASSPA